eukprot:TRINITY_DN27612_c0_g1_i1.p1 TRINITY_DN27612_c0_g1~~TRINITY_DN27612_c0_g1_i1.p1  ORF type:complete len:259 (-),score=45.72 TRINITY_DN27612_c0_g1_i1:359-1135(-)
MLRSLVGSEMCIRDRSQSAGLDSAAITWGLLGPVATAWRLLGAVFIAVLAGMAASGQSSNNAAAATGTGAKKKQDQAPGLVRRVAGSATTTAREVFPSILAGLVLSTVATRVLPSASSLQPSVFGALIGRLAVIGSSLPLQLCEHSTVTLAAGIQKAGGSAGLAFAFLLSAPATNFPTLFLLLRTHGGRSKPQVARVVLATILSALFMSYVVDFLELDLLVREESDAGINGEGLPSWYVWSSPWIAAALAIAAGKSCF